ncbi:MAG: hypothetical protein JW860_04210 [Sedimentisphaerales bacterium]|nr:hypothetical protein [Sedimentisphaerales bacterium]
MTLLWSCSASTQNSEPAAPPAQEEEIKHQSQMVRQMTDDILLTLAAHRYEQLLDYIQPVLPPLSGRQVAIKILGPEAFSLVLDRWNAEYVEVSFDDTFLWATVRLDVMVRLRPNRNPRDIPFVFRFHRTSTRSPWRLQVY